MSASEIFDDLLHELDQSDVDRFKMHLWELVARFALQGPFTLSDFDESMAIFRAGIPERFWRFHQDAASEVRADLVRIWK